MNISGGTTGVLGRGKNPKCGQRALPGEDLTLELRFPGLEALNSKAPPFIPSCCFPLAPPGAEPPKPPQKGP